VHQGWRLVCYKKPAEYFTNPSNSSGGEKLRTITALGKRRHEKVRCTIFEPPEKRKKWKNTVELCEK